MWDEIEPRLVELARRAGVTGVPAPVIAAAVALGVVACVWGVWRFWPRASGASDVVREAGVSAGGTAEAAGRGGGRAAVGGSGVGQEATGAAGAAGAGGAAGGVAAGAGSVVVHVAGAVRHPGVCELPPGSRVIDAVEAAGGLLPDAVSAAVNLARPVADGEQIVVPDEDDVAAGGGPATYAASGGVPSAGSGVPGAGGAGGGVGAAGPVDLNSADVALLDTLPGIGPATAAKIVADRETNGPYRSVDDLGRVSGIGEKRIEQLRDVACVR